MAQLTKRAGVARRAFLAGMAVAAVRPARAGLPAPPSGHLAFRLMRHGSSIGTHVMVFRRDADLLTVDIAVEVLVKFGPIPFVRYTHRNLETWRGDQIVGLASQTDRNGRRLYMQAHWTGSGLAVEGSGTKPYIAPPNALGTTHWNSSMLHGPMIGTQDGMLIRPTVAPLPEERIRLASGNEVPAKSYKLSGDLDLETWYDTADTWAGMRFTVDDGSVITYQRL